MKNSNIEKNLKLLLSLQLIDNKLNEIEKLKGELPIEMLSLKKKIIKFESKIDDLEKEFKENNKDIEIGKLKIKNIEKLIYKYKNQHIHIRNEKEYKAINTEIELQNLEKKILEKKIKEKYKNLEEKTKNIINYKFFLKKNKINLKIKKEELEFIMKENEETKKTLINDKQKFIKKIEIKLYNTYQKIKNNLKNKLAVVMIKRNACGGCFSIIPFQKQIDIKKNEKIILCEYCGRIFAGIIKFIL